MAFVDPTSFDVNNAGGANGGGEVLFDLKTLLVAQGWNVQMSGGGTGSGNFSAVGDVIASQAQMNVALAWYVIRQPAAASPRRQFLIQRGATSRDCLVMVSSQSGYVAGSADEDTLPANPADGRNVDLGTTSTTPTASFFLADSTYKYHIGADAAAPFGFYVIFIANGGGGSVGGFGMEAMATGSFPSADVDPGLYGMGVSLLFDSAMQGVGTQWRAWYQKGLGGEAFVNMPALVYDASANGTAIPDVLGANPYSSARETFPIPFARQASLATQIGWKGFTSIMLRWTATNLVNFDTLSVAAVRTKIIMDQIALPWPDVAPVL
jgi:hypothetical protein